MFSIFPDGSFLDYELDLLEDLFFGLDRAIEATELAIAASPDPDQFGIYDRMESIVGLGLLASQLYLNATYPGSDVTVRNTALRSGPRLHDQLYVAEAINAAANYFKHHDEWWIASTSDQGIKTRSQIESMGISLDKSYVMTCVLAKLFREPPWRLARLLPILEEWRASLVRAGPAA